MRTNTKRANKLLAISEQTKNDFTRFLSVAADKIDVTLLGVSAPADSIKETPPLHRYISTSWGYVKRPYKLDLAVPYLLYVGGTDSRRKLVDLVTAFNNLRGQGHQLKLVLAGDIMLGPLAITTKEIRAALKRSSYLDDIIFMGFVNDEVKDWLYGHALAFVFPSKYEGFGLPVLEAMMLGCPVISYRSQAVLEVAGDAPLYANDSAGLIDAVKGLLAYDQHRLDSLRHKGLARAKKFDWSTTSVSMFSLMTKD